MKYMNKNTYNKLFNEDIKINNESKDNDLMISMLEFFTLDKEYRIDYLEGLDERLYNLEPIYDKEKNKYNFCNINFSRISSFIIEDKRGNELYKELVSTNRYGKCHRGSLQLLFFNDSSILTGYITFRNKMILHSVVQVGNYIMDYTKNLVINKNDYIKLTNFKILQKITKEQVFEDKEVLSNFEGIDLRLYLTFRDEFVNEFNNKKLTLKD